MAVLPVNFQNKIRDLYFFKSRDCFESLPRSVFQSDASSVTCDDDGFPRNLPSFLRFVGAPLKF